MDSQEILVGLVVSVGILGLERPERERESEEVTAEAQGKAAGRSWQQ
jgi:hypothetical protein